MEGSPVNAAAMRLGKVEFALMNNPLRRLLQRKVEFGAFLSLLEKQRIDLAGKVIMDAGCGSGYSTELILKAFRPARVIAFDLMPEQIRLAARRGLPAEFAVGDMTRIDCADGFCDAAFVFGVLHHIPEWRLALAELRRVLKPGGVLLAEEPEYRFHWTELMAGMGAAGLEVVECRALYWGYFHTYLCRRVG
ncbi:methyltransferase family protein [Hydrogenispora ethanolica]|uniref:Methyltransferase family protein n=1 Tax=Hydrogenispora ethanolica TaxID=1082276 RepID=A0A4R1SBT4_HYDET|nr:class I SAM-dependent methyltransferase [Hydrogenispora ethanolica]TCL76958.1 methyltransferase family protein [Hydrogenispora ethanolica]